MVSVRKQVEVNGRVAVIDGGGELQRADHSGARVVALGFPIVHGRIEVDVVVGDRKSTRLNSSHLGISYAVFCLKKKKKKPRTRYRRMPGNVASDPIQNNLSSTEYASTVSSSQLDSS